MLHHVLFCVFSFIIAAGALQIQFPSPPVAASNSTFNWVLEQNDPSDFYLQKIKLDDPNGPTGKSEQVSVHTGGGMSGSGQILFRRAGLFQLIAMGTGTNKQFFSQEYTVQVNPASAGAIPQPTNAGSGHHGHHGGDGDDGDDGSIRMGMGGDSGNGSSNSSSTPYNVSDSNKSTKSDIPIIVGSVLGTVAFMFLVTAILLFFRYRRRRQTSSFQRGMMVRSPGSIHPWMIPPLADTEKGKEFMSSNSSHSSRSSTVTSSTHSSRYGYPKPPGLHPSSPTFSDSVGSSVSQRKPNEPQPVHLHRDSANTMTTTTFTLSSSRNGSTASGSVVQFPVPTAPVRPRTTRQMMIEEDIQELQGMMMALQGRGDLTGVDKIERDEQLRQITAKVEILKEIHEGPWALGHTETIPPGLF